MFLVTNENIGLCLYMSRIHHMKQGKRSKKTQVHTNIILKNYPNFKLKYFFMEQLINGREAVVVQCLGTRVGVSDDLDKNDDLMTPNRVIMT